jgi:acetyl-CoA C-acetyltransferase
MFSYSEGLTTQDSRHHSSLSSLSAVQLGSHAIKGMFIQPLQLQPLRLATVLTLAAAVERAGLKPEDVEEVFVGNVLSAK